MKMATATQTCPHRYCPPGEYRFQTCGRPAKADGFCGTHGTEAQARRTARSKEREAQWAEDARKAAHVRLCINAHDDLLAALRNVIDEYEYRFGKGGRLIGPIDSAIESARAAVAKATGK